MRQSLVECQNTDFDKEYRDEVLDIVCVPALVRDDDLRWLLFSPPNPRKLASFELENLMPLLSGPGGFTRRRVGFRSFMW